MGLDQLHEQNNNLIKNNGGATHLLNRGESAALEKSEVTVPELARLMSEFENEHDESLQLKHHEDTAAFRTRYQNDVKKLYNLLPCNPFELDSLTKINNPSVTYSAEVKTALQKIKKKVGKFQYKESVNERLMKSKIPITSLIKKNYLQIPGVVGAVAKDEDKKLVYSPIIMTKIREAAHFRTENAKNCFSQEPFGVTQALAQTSNSLYHSQKSDMLKNFSHVPDINVPDESAIIIDLPAMTRSHLPQEGSPFSDFARSLHRRICKMSNSFVRCDIICDRYFTKSLKEGTRKKRGIGTVFNFNDETKIPTTFEDFLSCSENIDRLNWYLAKIFISYSDFPSVFLVTYNDTILTSDKALMKCTDITNCISEEADQRSVRHTINCVKMGYSTIVVCTRDTGVLLLPLSVVPHFKEFCPKIPDIYCRFEVGRELRFYNINKMSSQISDETCKALPFFHSFTGCDTVSSFFNHSKAKFGDCWMNAQNKPALDNIFQQYSNCPMDISASELRTLELFVLNVYERNISADTTLVDYRFLQFKAMSNANFLPPCLVYFSTPKGPVCRLVGYGQKVSIMSGSVELGMET